MVDTLAPKTIYKQRDLDKSLTPSPIAESIMAPSKSVLSVAPKEEKVNPVLNTRQPDYTINKEEFFNRMTEALKSDQAIAQEQEQTVKSSQETQDVKQTGKRAERDVPQGLVMKPLEYAADGINDKEVSGPILVGEEGAELIVPTGDGKVSIVDALTTAGLMAMPYEVRGAKNIDKTPTEDLDITYQYTDKPSESIEQRRIYDEKTGSVVGFAPPGEYGGITDVAKNVRPDLTNETTLVPRKRPEQKMDKAEAVSLMTSDDAYADFNVMDTLFHTTGDKTKGEKSEALKNLEKFITAVHDVESNKGKNLYNKSSATGHFQFKTLTDPNDPTSTEGSAFRTALQRVENLYTANGQTIPYWVDEARQHNNPNKLSYKQQEELFLINLQQQVGAYRGETDQLLIDMMRGDIKAAKELFARFHHTNPNVLKNSEVKRKFQEAYNRPTIMGKPVKKAQDGMKNVDIGKPQKAGLTGFFDWLFPKYNKEPEPDPSSFETAPHDVPPKEPFDPDKMIDQESMERGGYGIDLDYYYDNKDEMAEYSIKQRKGQNYVPTPQELEKEKEDLDARFEAYWDMKSQEFDERDKEWAREQYMEPDKYMDDQKEKEELLEEYGPDILPTV